MVQHRRLTHLALGLAISVISQSALAVIGNISVSGASAYDLPTTASTTTGGTTTSTAFAIYGGNAGLLPTFSGSPTSPFSTCVNDVVGNLKACNENAIVGTVLLTISFTAGQDGFPALLPPTTSGTTSPITTVSSSGFTGANQAATLTVLWSDLCNKLSTTGNPDSSCKVTSTVGSSTATAPVQTFKLGVMKNATDTTLAESIDVQIQVKSSMGEVDTTNWQSTSRILSSGDFGLNEFEIGNGDGKVVLKTLAGTGIPSGDGLAFRAVRVLWTDASSDADTGAFNNISTATPDHLDATLSTSSSGAITLTPSRVTGLSNDHFYAFKVAVIDKAGNIGYYTDPTADTVCTFTAAGGNTCHFGHPGEVVGVLSKQVNCFVATAAYGSTMAPQVETFRQFRNQVLLKNSWGVRFVKFYYENSPKYARVIAEHPFLRALVRGMLWPFLSFAQLTIKIGFLKALAVAMSLLLLIGALLVRLMNERRPNV